MSYVAMLPHFWWRIINSLPLLNHIIYYFNNIWYSINYFFYLIFYLCWIETNFDCNLTFLVDLAPNGIPFGATPIGELWLQSKFNLIQNDSEIEILLISYVSLDLTFLISFVYLDFFWKLDFVKCFFHIQLFDIILF